MGCGGSSLQETNEVMGANGPLRTGTRVQTQWDEGSGHDNKWYVGTVEAVYTNGHAKVSYDDPDIWTGEAHYIYVLPPHHAGMSMKVTVGAPTMEGIPGMAPTSMAQPVGPPVMGMAPPGYGAPVGPPQHMAMPPQPMGMPPAGPQVMTVTATVPGGQPMQLQGPSGVMTVQVPPGIMPGQQFQFQAGGMSAPPTVMAQPVQATVVMATPV